MNTIVQNGNGVTESATVTPESFREAMARFASAVSIITTDGPGGKAGFTATAACSVTDNPPTILVCVKNESSVGEAFQTNDAVCLNTLGPEHEPLAMLFGGKTSSDTRFAAANWRRGSSGAPVLDDSLVSFDCRVVQSTVVGTHSVLFCEVQEIALAREASASVYLARKFHQIEM